MNEKTDIDNTFLKFQDAEMTIFRTVRAVLASGNPINENTGEVIPLKDGDLYFPIGRGRYEKIS